MTDAPDTPTPLLWPVLTHCGEPMRLRASRFWWDGDYQIMSGRWSCSCGAVLAQELREHVGPPSGRA